MMLPAESMSDVLRGKLRVTPVCERRDGRSHKGIERNCSRRLSALCTALLCRFVSDPQKASAGRDPARVTSAGSFRNILEA
jgi:hypothetical protein